MSISPDTDRCRELEARVAELERRLAEAAPGPFELRALRLLDHGWGEGWQLRPSPARRYWMDAHSHAYQCLPMVVANQWGWQVLCPTDVRVVWDGSPDPAGLWVQVDSQYAVAIKSQFGAGSRLPESGMVVITVKNGDKDRAVQVARDLHGMGYSVAATKGTAAAISQAGVPVKMVNKVKDGRPHIADLVKAGDVQLVFTTVDETRTAIADSRYIRTAALAHRVTYYTTMAGCEAATEAMKHRDGLEVVSLQELHAQLH